MTALTAWLTSTLPPESGPPLQWASAHLDLLAPVLVVALALLLWGLLRLLEALA